MITVRRIFFVSIFIIILFFLVAGKDLGIFLGKDKKSTVTKYDYFYKDKLPFPEGEGKKINDTKQIFYFNGFSSGEQKLLKSAFLMILVLYLLLLVIL